MGMKREQNGIQNQKGFSLVELIVAIAILAIVNGAIVGFIRVSSNFYQNVSSDVDLQYESQQAMNQMEDLLVDSTKGVSFESDTLMIYDNNIRHSVRWDSATKRLYYSKAVYTKKDDGSFEFQKVLAEDVLMAEYVSGFIVSFASTSNSQIVRLSLDMKKASKEYHVSQEVTLRNQIRVNEKEEDLYDESRLPMVSEVKICYEGVELDHLDYYVSHPDNGLFSAVVKGLNNPSVDVSWELSGDGSHALRAGTGLQFNRGGARLTVDENEENPTLFLRASSKVNPDVSDTIAIYLIRREVTGITITGPEKVYRSTPFDLRIKLEGNEDLFEYIDSLGDRADQVLKQVKLEGVTIAAGAVWNKDAKEFLCKAAPREDAKKVRITYGAEGTTKTATFEKTVNSKQYTVVIEEVSSSTDCTKNTDVIWRNQSKTYQAVAMADDGSRTVLDSDKVKWNYTAYYQEVNKDKKNDAVVNRAEASGNRYTITTNTYINHSAENKKFVFNEDYYIVITATVTLPDDADQESAKASKTLHIPRVTGSPSENILRFTRKNGGYDRQQDSNSFYVKGIVLDGQTLSCKDLDNQTEKVWIAVGLSDMYKNTVNYTVTVGSDHFNERTFTFHINDQVTYITIYVDGR